MPKFQPYANTLTITKDTKLGYMVAACLVLYSCAAVQFYHLPKDHWYSAPIPTALAGGLTAQVIMRLADKYISNKTVTSAVALIAMLVMSGLESGNQWNMPTFPYPITSGFGLFLFGTMMSEQFSEVPPLLEHFKAVGQKNRYDFCRFLSILAARKNWTTDKPGNEAAAYLYRLQRPATLQNNQQ